MKKLNLQDRIAFTYISVTAMLIAALFLLIYLVIHENVYSHLDADLDAEMREVYASIVVLDNVIVYSNPNEWTEKEHGQIEVNPVFIQIVDTAGMVLKKTANLRTEELSFNATLLKRTYLNARLSGESIRQTQLPMTNPTGRILAYLLIAVPQREAILLLQNLRRTLLIGYPIVLLVLFFISRFIAGRAVSPINTVIATAEKISRENLTARIALPVNKDVLHTLVQTINALLDRLEDVVLREKQFTADASHELRTPLSVIKGTLEVLTRKPREREYYVEKIKYIVGEVDRMSYLVDQLLELARFESGTVKPTATEVDLNAVIAESVSRLAPAAAEKHVAVHLSLPDRCCVRADRTMMNIVFDNILSNAVKYSSDGQSVEVVVKEDSGKISCAITDHGSGIPHDHLVKVFDRFYRVDESRTSHISGNGIGLAIVKRLADLQKLTISVASAPSRGTTFTILFP